MRGACAPTEIGSACRIANRLAKVLRHGAGLDLQAAEAGRLRAATDQRPRFLVRATTTFARQNAHIAHNRIEPHCRRFLLLTLPNRFMAHKRSFGHWLLTSRVAALVLHVIVGLTGVVPITLFGESLEPDDAGLFVRLTCVVGLGAWESSLKGNG